MPFGWLCVVFAFILLQERAEAASPFAVRGEMDLREWDFYQHPGMDLQGEWDFAWQQLIPAQIPFPPPATRSVNHAPAYSPVPERWNRLHTSQGNKLPAFGFATYGLRVHLPRQHPPLAIQMESPSTAAELWINGQLVAQSGTVSANTATSSPRLRNIYYAIPENTADLEIRLLVSNYFSHRGGFLRPMQIGDAGKIQTALVLQQGVRYFLSGSLLLMVLYHLILFLSRRNDRIQLYFTGMAFAAILRILIPGDHLIQQLLPFLSFEWIVRIEYMSLPAIIAFIALFVREFFPARIPHWLCQTLWGSAIGFAVFALFAPLHQLTAAQIVTQFINVFGGVLLLFYTARAVQKKDPGAKLVLLTLLVLYAAVINDILHARQIVHSFYASSYAIFLLVFVQWALMAERYSQTLRMLHLQREQFLRCMAVAIESKDTYTGGHVERVACFSRDLALAVGWDAKSAYELYLAAMVHDVGKIGVRDSVLNKSTSLEPLEMQAMQKHPGIGYHMLVNIAGCKLAAQIALHHHQRWNGKGYTGSGEHPALQGESIPIGPRIVAVADFWDAISSDRPYRKAMPPGKALTILIEESAVGLDPELIQVFLTKGIWQRYLQKPLSAAECEQVWNTIRSHWPSGWVEPEGIPCPA